MWQFITKLVLCIFFLNSSANALMYIKKKPSIQTVIDTRSVNGSKSTIFLKILQKPHHLFIGRCKPADEIFHEENIILNNDGKSQVSATIEMKVESDVYITCVQILDQVPDGEGGYPNFVRGGVGDNYVVFNVTTDYGKGFNFYVQIKGYSLNNEKT